MRLSSRSSLRRPPSPWALLAVLGGFALAPGCLGSESCLRNTDCGDGEMCRKGSCSVPPAPPSDTASGGTVAFGGAPSEAAGGEVDSAAGEGGSAGSRSDGAAGSAGASSAAAGEPSGGVSGLGGAGGADGAAEPAAGAGGTLEGLAGGAGGLDDVSGGVSGLGSDTGAGGET